MKVSIRSWQLLCLPILMAGCADVVQVAPSELLVDPEPVVIDDTVYMLSGAAGAIVRVTPGTQGEEPYTEQEGVTSESIHVGLGPQHLVVTPDGSRILVLNHERQLDELYIVDTTAACDGATPVDTGCVTRLDAKPLHDQLVLSPDGRFALSYISLQSAQSGQSEVVNLNEVGIYDLQSPASVSFVPLGFNPQGFAFSSDPADPRVVAITSSQVIALNLVTGETVPRELTLSSATQLTPSAVTLTGDNRFALVTVKGVADLYTFDLTQETLPINILSLSGPPKAMARSASGDETLVLTSGSPQMLNVIHHADFHIDAYELIDSATRILIPPAGAYAALYNSDGQGQYLYYVDLERGKVQPYLLDNPCFDVKVSPDGGALVLYYVPDGSYNTGNGLDGSYAVAILNLANEDRKPNPILISSYPTGEAFHEGLDPALDEVFVAFDGNAHGVVARFNLTTYSSESVETAPQPRMLSMLSDDRVLVVHRGAGGLISIFPQSDPSMIQFISGFMAEGLF